jgi:hypothetical protein
MDATAMQFQRHDCGSHAVCLRREVVLLGTKGVLGPVCGFAGMAVGPALGHQGEHLAFARAQCGQRAVTSVAGEQARDHLRVHRGAARRAGG